jgi:hypothetical protein
MWDTHDYWRHYQRPVMGEKVSFVAVEDLLSAGMRFYDDIPNEIFISEMFTLQCWMCASYISMNWKMKVKIMLVFISS